jgi:hypothetical protein
MRCVCAVSRAGRRVLQEASQRVAILAERAGHGPFRDAVAAHVHEATSSGGRHRCPVSLVLLIRGLRWIALVITVEVGEPHN